MTEPKLIQKPGGIWVGTVFFAQISFRVGSWSGQMPVFEGDDRVRGLYYIEGKTLTELEASGNRKLQWLHKDPIAHQPKPNR